MISFFYSIAELFILFWISFFPLALIFYVFSLTIAWTVHYVYYMRVIRLIMYYFKDSLSSIETRWFKDYTTPFRQSPKSFSLWFDSYGVANIGYKPYSSLAIATNGFTDHISYAKPFFPINIFFRLSFFFRMNFLVHNNANYYRLVGTYYLINKRLIS